jgi:hypothetical protein
MTVAQLKVGENGYLTFTEVRVYTQDLSVYLSPQTPLRRRALNTVEVKRTADGYTAYVSFTAVKVDAKDGKAYIEQNARLEDGLGPLSVAVTRYVDGCQLILHEKAIKFKPEYIADYAKLIPVTQITEKLNLSKY